MSDALIDANGSPSMTAILNTDGATIKRLVAKTSNHSLMVDDNTTGSDNGGTRAAIDSNSRQTLFAVSEIDGKTLVPLYATSGGSLMVDST